MRPLAIGSIAKNQPKSLQDFKANRNMSEAVSRKPTVFISYSHKDEVWKDRLKPHLKGLENAGRITLWDDRKLHGGEFWFAEIKEAMDKAALAVCLLTPNFLASEFCTKEEARHLLTRRDRDGLGILPVLVEDCGWKTFDWIEKIQLIPSDGKSIHEDFTKKQQNRVLLKVADRILEILDDPNYKPPQAPPPEWPAPEKVDLYRLPQTGAELFGRDAEMDWLDAQWDSKKTRIVSLIAWGGVGKSTLVNRWLERMAKDNYRGARNVFAWSFYSQGTGERVTSADQFIHEALVYFGDADPASGSPWDKGQRLAALVREASALLVLDGMEPLQSDNALERGKVKDPALATFLEALALSKDAGKGLCLITSRVRVADLREFPEACAERGLEQIATASGRALLRVGGVQGSDVALEKTAEAFGNHAFALKLLAAFLYQQPGHHICHAEKVPLLKGVSIDQGRHVRRVIAAFEDFLGEGLELALLRLLGLFDRPLEKAPLEALLSAPVIPGLTELLQGRSVDALLGRLNRLRDLGLLAERSRHRPDSIDAHPLVREHFKDELRQKKPEAWKTANARLFEHYRENAEERPDTLEKMAPLFLAMAHGCAAGRFQEALDEIYRRRILRGDEFFTIQKLGAFGSDLVVLSGFFERPWSKPVAALSEVSQSFVLNQAGVGLRALGQLREAVQPMEAGLEANIKQEHWKNTANTSLNLSELQLSLGDLSQAQSRAKEAVKWADQSGEAFQRMCARTALGAALFQSGRDDEAEALFWKAEQMQKEREPESPFLYSLRGYRYCELLLEKGAYNEVLERAETAIEISKKNHWLLLIALDQLSLGHAHLLQTQAEESEDWQKATRHLNQAVEGLRQAGQVDCVPLGLLARAALFRLKGQTESAQRDLDETFRLARRCGMRLFETDAHLEQARLDWATGQSESARSHFDQAKGLVKECGYHRRDGELEALEKALKR